MGLVRKQAIDTTARDYWTEYFGEYGEAWVRDIRRRVTAAVAQSVRRASRNADQANVQVQASPCGAGVMTRLDGTRLFRAEAYVRVVPAGADRRTAASKARRYLVAATFDIEGRMTALDQVAV